MSLPAALYAIRWLIADTFRQAMASGIFWLMFVVSCVMIVLCLSVSIDAPPPLPLDKYRREILPTLPPPKHGEPKQLTEARKEQEDKRRRELTGADVVEGQMTVGFGLIRVPLNRPRDVTVMWLQFMLVGVIADTIGIMLALIWTAGFLPTFLEASAVAVLLVKPVPRWSLLAGKYLGVIVFLAAQATFFVIGTWIALGISTGEWAPTYLLSIPLLVIHFAIFFSFSALLAVYTRSTVTCVFGALLFWLMCWGMNWGRHVIVHVQNPPVAPLVVSQADSVPPQAKELTPAAKFLAEVGYWVLPKPADMGIVLYDALGANDFMPKLLEFQTVQRVGAFQPELSLLASLLVAFFLLALAGYEFVTQDY